MITVIRSPFHHLVGSVRGVPVRIDERAIAAPSRKAGVAGPCVHPNDLLARAVVHTEIEFPLAFTLERDAPPVWRNGRVRPLEKPFALRQAHREAPYSRQ